MRKVTSTGSGKQQRIFTAAAMAAAAAAGTGAIVATPSADAGLMMDLRAVTINGQPLSASGSTPKEIVVGVGDSVTLDLFAVVSGTNGINDEQIQNVHGAVLSAGALLGNLAGGRVAPFADSGSQNGSVQDLDGDTDLDIGVTPNGGTPTTGYFIARSAAITPTTPINAQAGEVRVGSFTFTVTSGGTEVFLNFVRRANAAGGNITTAGVWFEDGIAKNPTLASYGAGTPVHTVIPEPATAAVTVAALAGLGLLARRRPTA